MASVDYLLHELLDRLVISGRGLKLIDEGLSQGTHRAYLLDLGARILQVPIPYVEQSPNSVRLTCLIPKPIL